MKIDIHVHTKKTKLGDSEKREILPVDFCNIISKTNVEICAITNHNYFDEIQFNEIVNLSKNAFQTWPGVELDICENGKRGHLIVIVDPMNSKKFAEVINGITKDKSPDDFLMGIKEVTDTFNVLDPIYIPHYLNKKPSISEEEIEILIKNSLNPKRILKEATNSISAGIFVSHGHKSIYGSDIQDWSEYINISRDLPDLRLPVESFKQFCLLLERDDSTIKTILDKKSHEKILLRPFREDKDPIELEIYNDINVLFGSKGTGKTEILKSLSEYYNKNGYQTKVYESNAISLDLKYDLKGVNFEFHKDDYDLELCAKEIAFIKNAKESVITSLKKYYDYFSSSETNKLSKNIKLKNFSKIDEKNLNNNVDEILAFKNELNSFKDVVLSNPLYKEVIGEKLHATFVEILEKVNNKLQKRFNDDFIESRTIKLFNHLIKVFVSEIAKKTGQPEKPIETGFLDYARNRIDIEIATDKIISSINFKFVPISQYVGNLGQKGNLFFKTLLLIHDGKIADGEFKTIKDVNKKPQKLFVQMFGEIQKVIYTENLFEKIAELNQIDNVDSINSIEDLILFKRFFEINYISYKPSNGESAMILLLQELSENKEIYLIDEPEKSLGNDYINDFIVPMLKEHAYSGKRVIIATHDANIAVRTLPYNSIYRSHTIDSYLTYLGNPFSNNLVCNLPDIDDLDWKDISMRTLEGGEDAFGERGKIYAKS